MGRSPGNLCAGLILFASEPFRLVKHLPHSHSHHPPSVMADSEHDEGQLPRCLMLQPFRDHPTVTNWHRLVLERQPGTRTPILAFVGPSGNGKTSKAVSFFGNSQTVRVHCQNFPTGVLPAVDLDGRPAAVVWEDMRADQLLNNRWIFAAGAVAPPRSAGFASHGNHQVDQPPPAMILCCNFLPMSVSEGLCAEEAFWMLHNVWKVTLDADTRWWLDL